MATVTAQKPLVLASASRRRRELAAAFDPPVRPFAPVGDEVPRRDGETPEELVRRLALAKAREAAQRESGGLILAADTVVVLDGDILGKPSTPAEAREMLARLRGCVHRVVTGVALLDAESGQASFSAQSTDVTMRRYSDAEVESYVASGEPFDKAGAYAAQDRSFHPAESVDGCYLNVVGLPMCDVATLLRRQGAGVRLRPDWSPPSECRRCPLRPDEDGRRP
jgi:MAF protein